VLKLKGKFSVKFCHRVFLDDLTEGGRGGEPDVGEAGTGRDSALPFGLLFGLAAFARRLARSAARFTTSEPTCSRHGAGRRSSTADSIISFLRAGPVGPVTGSSVCRGSGTTLPQATI